MNRRQFISSSGAAAVALTNKLRMDIAPAAPSKRGQLKLGTETQMDDARL
jgi:hypothetical protein